MRKSPFVGLGCQASKLLPLESFETLRLEPQTKKCLYRSQEGSGVESEHSINVSRTINSANSVNFMVQFYFPGELSLDSSHYKICA